MGTPTTRRLRATATTLSLLAVCAGLALTSSDFAQLSSLGVLLTGAGAIGLWRSHDRAHKRLARMRDADACWRALMGKSADSIMVLTPRLDMTGQCMGWEIGHANGRAHELFSRGRPSLIGQSLADVLPTAMYKGLCQHLEAAGETLRPQSDEHSLFASPGDETPRWFQHQIVPCDGGMLLVTRDTTDTHEAAMHHAAQHLRLATRVIETSGAGVVISDALDRIETVNPAFLKLSGMNASELIGQNAELLGLQALRDTHLPGVAEALQSGEPWNGEAGQVHTGGQKLDTWLSVSALRNERGQVTQHIRVLHDITGVMDRQRELLAQSRHDSLTGLPNRRAFRERLNQAMARARRNPQTLAVLYIDLDGFKAVNDRFGHAAGDEVLVEVARRLLDCVRLTDCVCRLAGDEFTVILEGAGPPGEVRRICQRILDRLSLPHEPAGHSVLVTPSIGAAVYEPGEAPEQTCERADAAMYTAKHAGKSRFVLSMPDRAEGVMAMAASQDAA